MEEATRRDAVLVRTGWGVAVLSVVLYATIPLSLSGGVMSRPGIANPIDTVDVLQGLVIFLFVFSGAWLVHVRPGNVIGWLILASGALQAVQMSAEAYGARALTDPDRSLPWGLPVMWLASWAWMVSLTLVVIVLPGLYPSGRAASRFWRWQVRGAVAGICCLVLLAGTTQGGVDDVVEGVRLPWDAPTWWTVVIAVPTVALVVGSVLVVLVGTLVRARRAASPERQQLLLLLAFLVAIVLGFFSPWEFSFVVVFSLLPVAVTVGVLRYRLLGIEVALRRTLLYAPLTLLVALVLGGTTTLLARLVPAGPLPLIAGSAMVAVLIFPVAGWLRSRVDRLVLGERPDPLAVVDRLGAGLEEATDDPVRSMLNAIAAATGSTYARVRDHDGEEIAAVGSPGGHHLAVPLRHGGRDLGTLEVGARPKEPRVHGRDARLISALAPHLAVVISSQILVRELAEQRERVTRATLAERDRLRRDLHDGLGPSMSGIALGLEAASLALADDPRTAGEVLARTRQEAAAAVAEIRRVLDGLRPAVLDRLGLVEALCETAQSLGMGRPGGVGFELDSDGVGAMAPQVEEAVFRIVAESLTNVCRHAAARSCRVSLSREPDGLGLRVLDDGRGIPADHTPGHGLESMARRASDLGGRLLVAAASPRGTEVSALIPLEAR